MTAESSKNDQKEHESDKADGASLITFFDFMVLCNMYV